MGAFCFTLVQLLLLLRCWIGLEWNGMKRWRSRPRLYRRSMGNISHVRRHKNKHTPYTCTLIADFLFIGCCVIQRVELSSKVTFLSPTIATASLRRPHISAPTKRFECCKTMFQLWPRGSVLFHYCKKAGSTPLSPSHSGSFLYLLSHAHSGVYVFVPIVLYSPSGQSGLEGRRHGAPV